MTYTICPNLLKKSITSITCKSSKVIGQIVYHKDGIKIYIDKEGYLLNEYQNVLNGKNTDTAIADIFIKYLEENIEDDDLIETISIGTFNGDYQNLVISISNTTSKKIVLNSKIDYHKYNIKGLKLYEPSDFLNLISGNGTVFHIDQVDQLNTNPKEANHGK